MRPGSAPGAGPAPRPPPPPGPPISPSPRDLTQPSGPRSQVPARRHGAALAPGARAAAAALRPAAPGGARQGRYRPPLPPLPPPLGLGRHPHPGAGIPEEALSKHPSPAFMFCPAAARQSTGQASLWSLTPRTTAFLGQSPWPAVCTWWWGGSS